MRYLVISIFWLLPTTIVLADDDKTVVPFIDGMIIETIDAVGTVEIRSQSLGPGACGTRFFAGEHSLDVLAPPLVWSDWYEITSHIGSVSIGLSKVVMCDTDVISEVRYFSTEDVQ